MNINANNNQKSFESQTFNNPLIFTDTSNKVYRSSNGKSTTVVNTRSIPYFNEHSSLNNGLSPMIYSSTDPTVIKSKLLPMTSCTYSTSAMSNEYYVPSKVQQKNGLQAIPPIFNELNSISIADSSVNCMDVLHEILCSAFKCANTHAHNYSITGLVFIDNDPISVKMNVWDEMDGNSRIEIIRCNGSALSFNIFFRAIKKRILQELKAIDFELEEDIESESFSMMSLDSLESMLMTDDNDDDCISYSALDLQRMADDIAQDSYQLETLVVILGSKSLKERVMEFNALFIAIKNCLVSTDDAVRQTAEKILS